MKIWQQSARQSLKNAQSCNDFFATNNFKDKTFPLKIPLEFATLIDKNNPDDPLLQQVISQNRTPSKDFSNAPLADEKHSPVSGLIHKYKNRVLLIASGVCAIHCQYCFRQNFDYTGSDAINNWSVIEDYIRSQPLIDEVILSGGDPLSLSDEKLRKLIFRIEQIRHIKTLRIHTRYALVIPSRITDDLASLLSQSPLNVVLVIHANHASELSADFAKQIKKLTGITKLNQSVLLAGVNDSATILGELSAQLFALGILPYYLHLLDKVSGAERFLVSDERAKQIHRQLQKNLSGYLVPKLVRDDNKAFKTWLV